MLLLLSEDFPVLRDIGNQKIKASGWSKFVFCPQEAKEWEPLTGVPILLAGEISRYSQFQQVQAPRKEYLTG